MFDCASYSDYDYGSGWTYLNPECIRRPASQISVKSGGEIQIKLEFRTRGVAAGGKAAFAMSEMVAASQNIGDTIRGMRRSLAGAGL